MEEVIIYTDKDYEPAFMGMQDFLNNKEGFYTSNHQPVGAKNFPDGMLIKLVKKNGKSIGFTSFNASGSFNLSA